MKRFFLALGGCFLAFLCLNACAEIVTNVAATGTVFLGAPPAGNSGSELQALASVLQALAGKDGPEVQILVALTVIGWCFRLFHGYQRVSRDPADRVDLELSPADAPRAYRWLSSLLDTLFRFKLHYVLPPKKPAEGLSMGIDMGRGPDQSATAVVTRNADGTVNFSREGAETRRGEESPGPGGAASLALLLAIGGLGLCLAGGVGCAQFQPSPERQLYQATTNADSRIDGELRVWAQDLKSRQLAASAIYRTNTEAGNAAWQALIVERTTVSAALAKYRADSMAATEKWLAIKQASPGDPPENGATQAAFQAFNAELAEAEHALEATLATVKSQQKATK